MKKRVVFFGTSAFGLPSFEQVQGDTRFDIVAVVTQPPKPTGRHQLLTPTPVAEWATPHQLQLLTPATLKTEEIQNTLRDLQADVFLVASYGLILPQGVLDIPVEGCINIHASLLPRYRGASPIAAAILNGDTATGITFMVMDAGCDTGPILSQLPCPITPQDTRISLEQRLAEVAASNIVPTLISRLNKKIDSRTQPNQGVSLAPRLKRQDGLAVWQDAARLERQTRAYQPWPGLWTTWNATEIKILTATTESGQPSEPAGTIVVRDGSWAIACERGYLIPTAVQFSGKKPQPADTIPGSYPNFIGSRLG